MRSAAVTRGYAGRAAMFAAALALVLQALLIGVIPHLHAQEPASKGQAHLHHGHHEPAAPAAPDKPTHHATGCCILCSVLGAAVGAPPAFILLAPLTLSVVIFFASIHR